MGILDWLFGKKEIEIISEESEEEGYHCQYNGCSFIGKDWHAMGGHSRIHRRKRQ